MFNLVRGWLRICVLKLYLCISRWYYVQFGTVLSSVFRLLLSINSKAFSPHQLVSSNRGMWTDLDMDLLIFGEHTHKHVPCLSLSQILCADSLPSMIYLNSRIFWKYSITCSCSLHFYCCMLKKTFSDHNLGILWKVLECLWSIMVGISVPAK